MRGSVTRSEVLDLPLAKVGRYWRSNHDENCASLVRRYADRMLRGEDPPPIRVRRSTHGDYWSVDDGYHRLHAHWLLGRETIRAEVVR